MFIGRISDQLVTEPTKRVALARGDIMLRVEYDAVPLGLPACAYFPQHYLHPVNDPGTVNG